MMQLPSRKLSKSLTHPSKLPTADPWRKLTSVLSMCSSGGRGRNPIPKNQAGQGCQMFVVQHTKTGKNIPKRCHKIYQMATKYIKWPQNVPTSSIARPSKIYPSKDFCLKICHLAILISRGV
jgi:hypothetical protein